MGNGGFTENAFEYAEAGLETESDYPYTSGTAGVTGSCNADSSKYVVKTTGYTTVSSSAKGESSMASYVSKTGPLSVCVDASRWSSYSGGILSTCGSSVDHCVQAVGIDESNGYWKVRNSWGTSWGESGFIRLAYGENLCEIASDANYASVDKAWAAVRFSLVPVKYHTFRRETRRLFECTDASIPLNNNGYRSTVNIEKKTQT